MQKTPKNVEALKMSKTHQKLFLSSERHAAPFSGGGAAPLRHGYLSPTTLISCVLAIYTIGLCFGTHLPAKNLPIRIHNDVACHFAAYFGLAAIVWLLFELRKRVSVMTSVAIWALITALGVLDETTQPLVGRSFELKDIAADSIGAATSIVLMFCGFALWRRRDRNWTEHQMITPIHPRRRDTDEQRRAA